MKRLLSVLAFLLLAAPAYAGEPVIATEHSVVGASAVVFPGTSTITLEDPWTQLARMSGPMLGSGGGCSASYGNELNTAENCVAPEGISEGDVTTGWVCPKCETFESSETAPQLGDHHLDAANTNASASDYLCTSLPALSASTVYRFSVYIRHNGVAANNGDWRCGLGPVVGTLLGSTPITITKANNTYVNYVDYFYYNSLQDAYTCQENNTDNDGGLYIDNYSIMAATLCYGGELHTSGNAASLTNEANATTGWNAINSLDSFVSDATGAADGSYHLKADATSNSTANNGFNVDLASSPFSLTDGHLYFMAYKAKHIGSGDSWFCGFSSTASGTPGITAPRQTITSSMNTYSHYGFSFTYSSSFRYFVCAETGTNNNGGLYLDSFSVKEITGQ